LPLLITEGTVHPRTMQILNTIMNYNILQLQARILDAFASLKGNEMGCVYGFGFP